MTAPHSLSPQPGVLRGARGLPGHGAGGRTETMLNDLDAIMVMIWLACDEVKRDEVLPYMTERAQAAVASL